MTVSIIKTYFKGGYGAVIDGHTLGGGIVSLTIEQLGDLRRLVSEAKAKLDSLKSATK
jgi:hypothetical protein